VRTTTLAICLLAAVLAGIALLVIPMARHERLVAPTADALCAADKGGCSAPNR
jgi:hypothetical protein